ncbi:MAG: hypothetical protein GY780_01090 [bacterium]|nr:hypothetical protein [bacterium]
MNQTSVEPTERTMLMTVFGWVMLAFGALSVFISGLSLVAFNIMTKEGNGELWPEDELAQLPEAAAMMIENLDTYMLVMLVSSVLMALAGFGVIKRKDWARLLSMALLAASIVATLVLTGLGFQVTGGSSPEGALFSARFLALVNITQALLSSVLHGWIIWKLNRPEVRGEFVAQQKESH